MRGIVFSLVSVVAFAANPEKVTESAQRPAGISPPPVTLFFNPEDESLTFTVYEASSGDTVKLDTGKNLKLLGVTSPKLSGPSNLPDYFADKAKAYTNRLMKGKEIKVTFDKRKVDRHGQWLGYVWLGNGELLNEKVIEDGYGFADKTTLIQNAEIREALEAAQDSARAARAGMWRDPGKAFNLWQEKQSGPAASPAGSPRGQGPATHVPNQARFKPAAADPQSKRGERGPATPAQRLSGANPSPQQWANPIWNSTLFNNRPPYAGSGSSVGVAPAPGPYSNPPQFSQPNRSGAPRRSSYGGLRRRGLGSYYLNHDTDGHLRGITPSRQPRGRLLYLGSQRVPDNSRR